MTTVKLKYVDRFVDRHGRWRYYFRRARGARMALPGKPGTPEFMTAYQSALDGSPMERPARMRGDPGTFDRLVQEYFASADYLRLAASSRRAYKLVMERFVRDEKIGHRLVGQMTRAHVQRIIAKRALTPGAANDLLKKIKILMRFGIENGWRRDDPTFRLKKFTAGEFHTWTDEEIARYQQHWPFGSRERTGFALLLYTGQRVGDVSGMSWGDVEEDAIWVVQAKTGAKLLVPLHGDLATVLSAWPKASGAILTTSFGRRFTAKGLANFMADKIGVAGLPERCVTHGLRKAAARRLAEAGCSANEIAAITGHATLKEVERYTKAAEQKKLARAAIGRLGSGRGGGRIPNLEPRFGINPENPNKFNADFDYWRTGQGAHHQHQAGGAERGSLVDGAAVVVEGRAQAGRIGGREEAAATVA